MSRKSFISITIVVLLCGLISFVTFALEVFSNDYVTKSPSRQGLVGRYIIDLPASNWNQPFAAELDQAAIELKSNGSFLAENIPSKKETDQVSFISFKANWDITSLGARTSKGDINEDIYVGIELDQQPEWLKYISLKGHRGSYKLILHIGDGLDSGKELVFRQDKDILTRYGCFLIEALCEE